MSEDTAITSDGYTVSAGETVWRVPAGRVNRRRVDRALMSWMNMGTVAVFVSAKNALGFALSTAQEDLKRARRDVQRETAAIARFKAALSVLGAKP